MIEDKELVTALIAEWKRELEVIGKDDWIGRNRLKGKISAAEFILILCFQEKKGE